MSITTIAGNQVDALSILTAIPGSHLILLPDAPRFTIVEATDSYLADTHLNREDAIGIGVFDALTDDPNNAEATGVRNLSASLNYVLEHKKEHRMADQRYDIFNRKTGVWEERMWRPLNKPVFEDNGTIRYIIHWVEDVTEKLRLQQEARIAEQKLTESENRFRSMVEQAPVAILLTRGEEVMIESVNVPMLRFLNHDVADQVIGKKITDVLPELAGQSSLQTVINVQKTGKPWVGNEVPVDLVMNGRLEHRYFNFSYTPVLETGKVTGVLHVAMDVTEQVVARQKIEAAQQATARQKRLYQTIGNATPDLQYIFSLDYHFTYANDALLRMWAQTKEEAFGKGLRELGYEEWHAAMHEREIDEVVATKKPIRGVVSFPHAELGKRIYDYVFVPVLNEHDEVEAVAGTTRDITEFQQAADMLETKVKERTQKLEELNRELQRSNANLEEFAHAASHDLKEPIRKVHFFTHQLKNQLNARLNNAEHHSFARIENATQRMINLIDDLLVYSHVSERPQEMESIDLNNKVKNVMEDLELDIEEKQAVFTIDKLPVVNGYRRQLQQLFQNLISNALKYSQAGVAPEIKITARTEEKNDKRYHVIGIKDNGIGFEQEYADKIFQMFTRLHGKGEYAGTGIGLAIVKKVAENHNGSVEVQSAPGLGTTFNLYLPVN